VSASDAGWGDVDVAAEPEAEEKPDENIAVSGDTPEPPADEAAEIVIDAPAEAVAAAATEAPAEATVADGEEGHG
jgi:hypothetical protein